MPATPPASPPLQPLPHLQQLQLTVQDQIAHLVFNQPDTLNTLHPHWWQAFEQVLHWLHHSAAARVLVISSTGKHFSAGMDLATFAHPDHLPQDHSPEGRAALADLLWDMQRTLSQLEALRMPVIAVVQGGCIGGALDLLCCTCLRYATADAFFCVQEINIGMVADLGSLQRLPKLLPMALVKELAYTGRRWPAAQALAAGFINGVHPSPADALAAAMDTARRIAAKPPVAIWGSKQALHYARDHSVADSLQHMGWLQAGIWSNRHLHETAVAQHAQRAPHYPDLAPWRRFADLETQRAHPPSPHTTTTDGLHGGNGKANDS